MNTYTHYHMYMLTKRTNILFMEDTWADLVTLAQNTDSSVGELVRNAVSKTYFSGRNLSKRTAAVNSILKNRVRVRGLNYKDIISDGRKY